MMARQIANEVRANFQAWVEQNFFNARAGRIGGVSYARAGEGRRHRSGWKTGRPPPLVRGGIRPCPRRPHRAPARGRGGFPPSQPAHRPPARTRRHGPTRPSLSAARPHARGQPPPGTFLPRALLYTRQRPPPCPRRRAAADHAPYDREPLSNAERPTRGLFRTWNVARGAYPPRQSSGGSGVLRGQLPPLRAGRRNPRAQRRRAGLAARTRTRAFRPLQDAHAPQGPRAAPPPGGGRP